MDRPARYPSTDGEDNATVVHLAQFTAAQEESLELVATELECAYETLQRAEERIATLEEALYGQHDHEEEQQEEDPEEPEEPAEAAEPEGPVAPAPSACPRCTNPRASEPVREDASSLPSLQQAGASS